MNILIVEDNLAHLKITEHILRKHNVDANLHVVRDGQEALDFLFRREPFQNEEQCPTPDLILLDLNLPRRDGREVLKLLSEEQTLSKIPVVIISTSDREEDVAYARQFGAVGYISKSSGFDNFGKELGNVTQFARPR